MPRLIPLLLGALLASDVSGKKPKKSPDQIDVYQWLTESCDGMPLGAQIDLGREECYNTDANAQSIKPRFENQKKGWLSAVNIGALECKLLVWHDTGCDGRPDEMMDLPGDFDKCYTKETPAMIRSVKFSCARGISEGNSVLTTLPTDYTVITHTGISWSFGVGGTATPITLRKTLTFDPQISPGPFDRRAINASSTLVTSTKNTTLDAIAPSTLALPLHFSKTSQKNTTSLALIPRESRDDEEEKKQNVAYTWMYHPWSRSIICYQCFTLDKYNFNWIKCYSKRAGDAHCGARPFDVWGNPLTTRVTREVEVPGTKTVWRGVPGATRMATSTKTFATSTVAPTTTDGVMVVTVTKTLDARTATPTPLSTSTSTSTSPSNTTTSSHHLSPRSWHKRVTFTLPWNRARACADAEWEKRGRPNTEIRLQEVFLDSGNECGDAESIDLRPAIKETVTRTRTDPELEEVTRTVYTGAVTLQRGGTLRGGITGI